MKRIAKFEKVSLEEFMKDWCDTFELDTSDADTRREIEGIYGSIELPKRATVGSAGYDFFTPLTLNMKPGETVKVPTGIRCKIDEGWVLKCDIKKFFPSTPHEAALASNTVCSLIIQ